MLIFIICAVFLTSCDKQATQDTHEIEAISLNEAGGTLLFYTLNGINSSLVSVNTANAKLTALDGSEISESDFRTEQLVTIVFDGMIAESYPGQIITCYGIRVTGEADPDKTAEALDRYMLVHTREAPIFYVDASGTLAEKLVSVVFGNYFGEWKKANGVSEEVRLLNMTEENNSYEETAGDSVVFHVATVRNHYLDLSEEFLIYLSSVADERAVVASLVKTIIGKEPYAEDTAVFLTVNGTPLKTERNDFSGRLKFVQS
jgi:hypothetical protein